MLKNQLKETYKLIFTKDFIIIPKKIYNITEMLNFYYNLVNPIDLYLKINKIYIGY